ncbi:MAG: hypothetical protein ACKO11_04590, partial [Cuspidothrix sp.]
QVIPVSEPVKDGLIIMALASGPPALPKLAQIVKGNLAFSTGLMMMLMMVSVLILGKNLPELDQEQSTEIERSLYN